MYGICFDFIDYNFWKFIIFFFSLEYAQTSIFCFSYLTAFIETNCLTGANFPYKKTEILMAFEISRNLSLTVYFFQIKSLYIVW